MLIRPRKSRARFVWAAVFFIALISGIIWLWQDEPAEQRPTTSQQTPRVEEDLPEKPEPIEIPETVELDVAFTAQAPTGNWDELHNEACEEASVIMTWAYFNDITSLPPARVEAEITKLTNWQQDNYGYYLSITTEETARMAEEVYGLETQVTSFGINKIKQALAEDKLVIVPAQGQLLGNPNFTAPGPPYHMYVITGYRTVNGVDYFITNDPGTRRGEDYEYTFDTVETSTGNYSHATKEVSTLDQDIIIVSK